MWKKGIRALVWAGLCSLLVAPVGCNRPCEEDGKRACRELAEQVAEGSGGEEHENRIAALSEACEGGSSAACEAIRDLVLESPDGLNNATLHELLGSIRSGCEEGATEGETALCEVLIETTTNEHARARAAATRELAEACIVTSHRPGCERAVELLYDSDQDTIRLAGERERTRVAATKGCEAGSAALCAIQGELDAEHERREEERRAREREREEERAREQAVRDGMRSGHLNCSDWAGSRRGTERLQMCEHLAETVREGRTNSTSRSFMQRYLRDELGVRRISGYIIANVGENLYEAVMRGYDSYFGVSYPRGQHFLLRTTVTDYSSRGRFNSWVTKVGTRDIDTVNGFVETWDIYEESRIGGLWHHVRQAAAGHETSRTASAMLRALR